MGQGRPRASLLYLGLEFLLLFPCIRPTPLERRYSVACLLAQNRRVSASPVMPPWPPLCASRTLPFNVCAHRRGRALPGEHISAPPVRRRDLWGRRAPSRSRASTAPAAIGHTKTRSAKGPSTRT